MAIAKYEQELTYRTSHLGQTTKITLAVGGLADINPKIVHDIDKDGNHSWLIDFGPLEFDQYYYVMGICDGVTQLE